MRVLMFGWEFPPHITGGLGTACFGLTKGLLKQGVEVLFVVPKAFGDESQEAVHIINASDVEVFFGNETLTKEITENLSYIEVGSNLIPYAGFDEYLELVKRQQTSLITETRPAYSRYFEFSGKYGHNLFEEVNNYAIVASRLAEVNSFDIIHAHDWLTYPAGIMAKHFSGKPLVVHMHATEFDRSGENVNGIVYDIEKRGMEEADRVITVSHLTRNIVIERYGINPDKVFTVHNAVEPVDRPGSGMYHKNVKEKVVTFLGRITFQKGPEYFVEAAYKILEKDPDVRFVMAGTGDLMNKMVHRIAQLGIATKFHFTGFLKGDDVDKMFALSDVYVMPSISEPFGISPLEAMRSSVPVVISKQSGVSEILNHAIKVDFWDIDAMADAIWGILHYDALSSMFRKEGKAEVEKLKWENAARKVFEVYQSIELNQSVI
ncbi:MAG: glycosyltransferase family 4 protein [Bacteroidetes bacterium]|nr:glycosyltransferase family 4 protein [Bacteroidota bacterium]